MVTGGVTEEVIRNLSKAEVTEEVIRNLSKAEETEVWAQARVSVSRAAVTKH